MPDVLIVVDMQIGLLDGVPKRELSDVVGRINRIAASIRSR
jgi:nicotinamidase-related amidase